MWQGYIQDGAGKIREFQTDLFKWHDNKHVKFYHEHFKYKGELTPFSWIPYPVPISAENVAIKTINPLKNTAKEGIVKGGKKGTRHRFVPNPHAEGAHSVFRRDSLTGKVNHYETFRPQTNPYDPKPWKSVKRFDGFGEKHLNKQFKEWIETPHMHDPTCPGGIRPTLPWEIPK